MCWMTTRVGSAVLTYQRVVWAKVRAKSKCCYRSIRRAYSSILIRRMRSSLMFSNDRLSPSSNAIRACHLAFRRAQKVNVKGSVPSSPHEQSPIRFCRAHSVSTLSGGSGEHWRGCSPGHSVGAGEAGDLAAGLVGLVADFAAAGRC